MGLTKHPAKFSEPILEKIADMLDDFGWPTRIIDPFAGVGRVHRLRERHQVETVGVELEPEWAEQHPDTVVGNALALPFPAGHFDGMATSPCYGSRMADHHNAQDKSRRYSYTHTLGRTLHPDNSGAMQWGDRYRDFHTQAWAEALRVLRPESIIVLNVSNHIRRGVEQRVTEWHLNFFLNHGCAVLDLDVVNTSRLRHGVNREARPRFENVIALRYVAPVLTPEEPDDEEQTYDWDHVWRGTGVADYVDAAEGGNGA